MRGVRCGQMTTKKTDYDKTRMDAEQAINEIRKIRGKGPIYETHDKLPSPPEAPLCSFRGKGANQAKMIIEANGAYICNECVMPCQDIISR